MIFLNGVLLGLGLAADAFLISLSNGLAAPRTARSRVCAAALVFALFQFAAPMAGWLCMRTVAARFAVIEKFIGVAAFAILGATGVKTVVSGARKREIKAEKAPALAGLLLQAALTSADALSAGFAITALNTAGALITSALIAAVTFSVYAAGFLLGGRFGAGLAGKAEIAGGVILIGIGAEALLSCIL